MVAVANKLIIVAIVVGLIHKIHTSSNPKFSFKKVFKTPRENYEERIAELDKCEILERSNFSSEEDEDGKASSSAAPNPADPKVFVNAEVNVRFGDDSGQAKPKQDQNPPNLLPHPSLPFPPMHSSHPCNPFHLGFNGPYGHAHQQQQHHHHVCPACLGSGWYNPYHYYYHPGFHPFMPAAHPVHNKDFFQSLDGQSCSTTAAQEVPRTTTTKPVTSTANLLPKLPVDDWMSIAGLFEGYGEHKNEITKRNSTCSQPPTPAPCHQQHGSNPTTYRPKTTTEKGTKGTSFDSAIYYGNAIECTHEPPSCKATLAGDIIIDKVEKAASCEDSSANPNCLQLSDRVEFIKINKSDLGNCSDVDEVDDNDGNRAYDMDSLYRINNNPISVDPTDPIHYPFSPFFSQWWFSPDKLGPHFPPPHVETSADHGCEQCAKEVQAPLLQQ